MKTAKYNVKAFFYFLAILIILVVETNVCQAQNAIMSERKSKKNLQISQPTSVTIGSVCPGCQKTFSTESYCLEWAVSTTRSEQDFKVFFHNPSNASNLNLDWVWTYQDDFSGEWKEFNNCKNPTGANGHTDNVFKVESSSLQCLDVVRFRVCVTGLQVPSTQTKCNLVSEFNVTVSCYSGCDDDDDDDRRDRRN